MGHMPLVDQYDLMVEKTRAYWIQEFPATRAAACRFESCRA